MPECENCGEFVTREYSRVFARDGDDVACCPFCPDTVRDKQGHPREARAPRRTGDDNPNVGGRDH